ncbi:peptidase C45 [Microbacterium mangrovi]|uniref:Peptidase C45 n=1 Tax=Microbacterium mangrovi TaxID=1348253 RepID=A0A0B2A3F8_9MICO|nr:C45 family peptidase [Microbacterium mangrovi]KHK98034.1 peptidase C45 [Microbacterium mangrovi]
MKLQTVTIDAPTPTARGHLLGTRFAAHFRASARLYDEHFAELGIAPQTVRDVTAGCVDRLADWAPGQVAEFTAIAAAADLDPVSLFAVAARTEILATVPAQGEGECSTAVLVGPGRAAETIQTWDWHGHLVPDGLLAAFESDAGLRVKMFTEFGTAAKLGVNSAGIGLHFNILRHESDRGFGGVPVHSVARRVLDEARTLDETEQIAASAAVSASTVLTVFQTTDAGSDARGFELSPAGLGVLTPGNDGWLLHTNHFLDPVLAAGDCIDPASTTAERYAHLDAARARLVGQRPVDRARLACGADGSDAVICMRADESLPRVAQWETLLTVGIDTVGIELDYFAGAPDAAASAGLATI